jgi:hypothetical protein
MSESTLTSMEKVSDICAKVRANPTIFKPWFRSVQRLFELESQAPYFPTELLDITAEQIAEELQEELAKDKECPSVPPPPKLERQTAYEPEPTMIGICRVPCEEEGEEEKKEFEPIEVVIES